MRRLRFFLFLSCSFLFSKLCLGGTLLIADKSKGKLHFLDSETYTERAHIKIDNSPHEIAVSPSGKTAVISHYGTKTHPGKTLSLIDIATAKLKGRIIFDEKACPHGLAFLSENQVLVTLEGSQDLALVNLITKQVMEYYDAPGKKIHMVILGPKKEYVYITNKDSGHVLKVSVSNWEMVRKTKIGKSSEGMAVTKDGNYILVTNPKENKVSFLETKKLKTVWEQKVSKGPVRLLIFNNDQKAAVTSFKSGKVEIINLANGTIENKFRSNAPYNKLKLVPGPISIIPQSENKALVANSYPLSLGHIALMDLQNGWIDRAIFAGQEPDGMAYSSVDVGDPLVASVKRSLESKQCINTKKGLCYDEEGYPLSSLKYAYAVINAPKKKVWKVLTDLRSFGKWNPFMVEAQSTLQEGDPISFKVILNPKFPKMKHSETLYVSKREEHSSICWERRVIGKAFEAKRCFNLVELEDGRTVYYTRERFRGGLAGTMSKLTGSMVLGGITREAEALKKYVEAKD